MSALSAAHEGTYLFLIVRDGRSFPCEVLRIEDTEATVRETDHDESPFSLRTVCLDEVAGVITEAEAEGMLRPFGEPSDNFMRDDVPTYFTYLRGYLNGEDLLARPRAADEELEIPGADFEALVAEHAKQVEV